MTRRARPPTKSVSASDVADRLHSAAIHLLRRLRRTDPASGPSPARLSALSVITFGGALTLGELAAAEQVRPPTMSRIVSGLAADGLVKREVDARDHRAVLIRATAKGVRVLQRGRKRRIDYLAKRIRSLSQAETAALDRSADIIERIASELKMSKHIPRRAT